MAKAAVRQHTRQMANGTKVKVRTHRRVYQPAAEFDNGGRTPVQALRRDRVRAEAKKRREEAMFRGAKAAKKGWKATKRRGKQSKKLIKRGLKDIFRAADMVGRKRKAAATCLLFAGVAEVGAAVAWQGIGLTVTTVSILGAVVGGGLLIGGKSRRRGARRGSR